MTEKDYSKTVMYGIKCKDDTHEPKYIGSSRDFNKRRNKHKYDCNNPNSKRYTSKLYQHIRENGGWDNWTIYQIETYPCTSKEECEARERYWFDTLKPTLNKNRPRLNDTEVYRYQFDSNYREKQKQRERDKYSKNQDYRLYKVDKALRRYYDNRDELKAKALKRYHDKKNENNVSH